MSLMNSHSGSVRSLWYCLRVSIHKYADPPDLRWRQRRAQRSGSDPHRHPGRTRGALGLHRAIHDVSSPYDLIGL